MHQTIKGEKIDHSWWLRDEQNFDWTQIKKTYFLDQSDMHCSMFPKWNIHTWENSNIWNIMLPKWDIHIRKTNIWNMITWLATKLNYYKTNEDGKTCEKTVWT